MGARADRRAEGRATVLRQRLDREGYVEARLHPVKVGVHLAFFVVMLVGIPFAFVGGFGPVFGGILAVLFEVWFVVAVGSSFGEQVFGSGPPLRIDEQGITWRRWGRPLLLPWSDVAYAYAYSSSRLTGPVAAIQVPPWVWHDYQAGRPPWLRPLARLTHFRKGLIALFKVLTLSATEVLALLDHETIDQLSVARRPFRLVLDVNEEDPEPLWLRNGRTAPLGELRLTPELSADLRSWNSRVRALLETPDDQAQDADQVAKALAEDGRALAAAVEAQLGQDSRVLFSGDVPG